MLKIIKFYLLINSDTVSYNTNNEILKYYIRNKKLKELG